MSIDDMIVMDLDGNIVEGTRKPSSDTPAILHIFRERPDINAVIHTHQPYATAISLIPGLTEFRVCITALANAAGGNVPITPVFRSRFCGYGDRYRQICRQRTCCHSVSARRYDRRKKS